MIRKKSNIKIPEYRRIQDTLELLNLITSAGPLLLSKVAFTGSGP